MARKSFIQIGGKLYDKEALSVSEGPTSAVILGDVAEFVSPIDGSVVSGRAGLRDHCARHNVVLTEELKGLPTKPMTMSINEQYREATRRNIAEIVNSRGYFRK